MNISSDFSKFKLTLLLSSTQNSVGTGSLPSVFAEAGRTVSGAGGSGGWVSGEWAPLRWALRRAGELNRYFLM